MLTDLWNAGNSTREIANIINALHKNLLDGCILTKNSIVGRINRIGNLERRANPIGAALYGPPRPPKPRVVRVGLVSLPELAALKLDHGKKSVTHPHRLVPMKGMAAVPPLLKAPRVEPATSKSKFSGCQWPLNDGRPWRFCGDRVVSMRDSHNGRIIYSSYCDKHRKKAYRSIDSSSDTPDLTPWLRGRV